MNPKNKRENNYQGHERDTLQPSIRRFGKIQINEDFIKVYGIDAHPDAKRDPEMRKFYQKKEATDPNYRRFKV